MKSSVKQISTEFIRIFQPKVLFLSQRTKVERYQIRLLVTVLFQQPLGFSEDRDTFDE